MYLLASIFTKLNIEYNFFFFTAYGITYQCIKICIDCVSKFQKPPNGYSVTKLWEALQKHFSVQTVLVSCILFIDNRNSLFSSRVQDKNEAGSLFTLFNKFSFTCVSIKNAHETHVCRSCFTYRRIKRKSLIIITTILLHYFMGGF